MFLSRSSFSILSLRSCPLDSVGPDYDDGNRDSAKHRVNPTRIQKVTWREGRNSGKRRKRERGGRGLHGRFSHLGGERQPMDRNSRC